MLASSKGHVEVVNMLMEAHADVHATNNVSVVVNMLSYSSL